MTTFTASRVVGISWRALWGRPWPWIFWSLVGLCLSAPTMLLTDSSGEPSAIAQELPMLAAVIDGLTAVLSLVWSAFMTNASLRALDGERLTLASFVRVRHFGAYLATAVLLVVAVSLVAVAIAALAVTVSSLLLVLLVPLVVVAVVLSLAQVAAIDRGTVWRSFSASAKVVSANVVPVLLLLLIGLGLVVAAVATLGLGLLVVMPLGALMTATAWRLGTGGRAEPTA